MAAAACWQGEIKGLESNPVFLKRIKYLKKQKNPTFWLLPRFLLLPLKLRVWLLLPRNTVGFARHENKQAPLNKHWRLPAQAALQAFLAAALHSAISRNSPKWQSCPSAWGYWMTSICAVFPPLALKSLVSEISSCSDTTPLCQISFNKAAEETEYLFEAHMTRAAFTLSDYVCLIVEHTITG